MGRAFVPHIITPDSALGGFDIRRSVRCGNGGAFTRTQTATGNQKFGLGVHGSKNGLLMVERIIFFLVRVIMMVLLQYILMVIIFILILIRQDQILMVQ